MAELAPRYWPSEKAVEEGTLAYLRWINPPHSTRQPTETDRNRVRAVLVAAVPIELAASADSEKP